ncbi:ABI gene family member 3 isoform X1 [Aquarana catesbeiana]|uniref:ABI gene family member 3 isoform X1 n=1 Tax=Aquarana catesbeiana TaxID=8400 RepID=UPI003CC9CAF3
MTDNYRELSAARQALRDSYQNLQNVADYCEKNYMEAPDKRKALENTMSLVTQTLASVVSQVGIAARYMSEMLEEQSLVLQKEEAKVKIISQLIDIHGEKVSRRKIGGLTISKKFPRTQKIVYGENKGPQSTYVRNPINFSSLDNMGHGIVDSETQQLSKTGTMSRKISVKSMTQAQNSFGRSCRIKDPVAPPLVPDVFQQIPNGTASSIPNSPIMGNNLPLPPLPVLFEHCDPPADERHTTGSDAWFSHFSPTDNTDEFLPPPPTNDYAMTDTCWPKVNGSQLSGYSLAEYIGDSLPPPPAPEFETTGSYWSSGNASDVPPCPPPLDDLPPPPDC